MDRAEQARRNRARMPETARVIDEFRGVFGPMTRTVYAEEGGHVVGRKRPPERCMNADQWLHFLRTGELPAEERTC